MPVGKILEKQTDKERVLIFQLKSGKDPGSMERIQSEKGSVSISRQNKQNVNGKEKPNLR
jgi:hypothetical protein